MNTQLNPLYLVYAPNCFFIKDPQNIFSNFPLFGTGKSLSLSIMGLNSRDAQSINEAISVDHELNHYIQDLSLSACIARGFLLDYISAEATGLMQNTFVRYPLSIENIEQSLNDPAIPSYIKDALKRTKDLILLNNYLFVDRHVKPSSLNYRWTSDLEQAFTKHSISFTDLLETYAYHKSFWDAMLSCSDDNVENLRFVIKENNVYPFVYRNGEYQIHDYHKVSMVYHRVNWLLLIALNFQNVEYLNYCENDIPKNYKESPAVINHSLFKVILETSLNIPGLNYILTETYIHHVNPEQFSPVHRFYMIIKAIRDYRGCPDSVHGEDFFKTFHDWVSNIYGWMSFDDTRNSVVSELYKRARMSEECIPNYQLTAVLRKHENFSRYAQSRPMDIIRQQGLPIISDNKKCFVFDNMIGNLIQCSGTHLYPYNSFYGEIVKYEHYNYQKFEPELAQILMSNNVGALREIVCRLFSSELISHFVNGRSFQCPFYNGSCPRASNSCASFDNFKEVFSNCALRILRIGKFKIIREANDGNTYDCMLFNYLLDKGCPINCLV